MYVNVAGWKDQVCSGYIGGKADGGEALPRETACMVGI